MHSLRSYLSLLFLLTIPAGLLHAEEQLPAWELGVGIAALSQPHYLGANDSRVYVLPIPYFKYRGKILRADRNGLRARLFESERFSLGISGGGSFPVDSEDNELRTGMPDLDVLAELGPNLKMDIVDSAALHLQFELPVRAAFAFGDDAGNYEGWTSNPRLSAHMPVGDWNLKSSFGLIFSDQKYHQYSYGVDAPFSTASRAEYRASAGYTGLNWGFSLNRYFKNMHTNLFFRYFNMQGAENEDSPLFAREHNISAGITVSWILKRSKRMVTAEQDDRE
ncbi:MAG: MipA/OmpV family protein [Pseudomonadales bacterium]